MTATRPVRSPISTWGPAALEQLREARRRQQDAVAPQRAKWIRANSYYYGRLKRLLQFIIEPGMRVLELRCETGQFLASVKPSYGVGVEISDAMAAVARQENPQLRFVKSDPEELDLGETFDYVIVNHIFDTVDILGAFEHIRRHCSADTLLVVINYNQFWQPLLQFASKMGLRSQFVEPNWVSGNDIRGFLRLAGFRMVRMYRLLLFPKWIPLVSAFLNSFVARLPGIRRLCMMQVIVARPIGAARQEEDVSVSVIVPCRNEAGNVQLAVERIPSMGRYTEIVFCDDKSTDDTADEVH